MPRKRPTGPPPEDSGLPVAEMASKADLGVRVVHARLGQDEDAPEIVIEPGRYRRAVKIATTRGQIVRIKDFFRVRSQSGGGSYDLKERGRLWICECQDASELRPCQHVLGLLLHLGILPFPEATPPEPKKRATLAAQDWSAYVKAERAVGDHLPRLARQLFDQLPQPPPPETGRPPIPQTDSLLCALSWAAHQHNARQEQATRDRLLEEGLLTRPVAANDVSRTLTDGATRGLLEAALRKTREPFAQLDPDSSPLTLYVGDTFAIDSTGFTPSRRGHYNREKHGLNTAIPWLKCHLMISTKANLITAAAITGNTGKGSGDSSQFAPLLDETADAFSVGIVVGDGAYASRDAVNRVRDLGAESFFRLPKNTISKQLGAPGWADMVSHFKMDRAGFDAIYHRRSKVESVNSALKRRFGEALRCKTPASRVNELLCKLVAYNLVVLIQAVHFAHAEEEWLSRILTPEVDAERDARGSG